MAAEQDIRAERILAELNETIRAGEAARQLRAEMVTLLLGLGWTQQRIARLTGMTQPAVSKQALKAKEDATDADDTPRPPLAFTLRQYDVPWLEGRLWGLAEFVTDTLAGTPRRTASCAGHLRPLQRGRDRVDSERIDALRRSVEEDLRQHTPHDLPAACRDAYDEIGRALDVPDRSTPSPAAGSPTARRALARRLQWDELGRRSADGNK